VVVILFVVRGIGFALGAVVVVEYFFAFLQAPLSRLIVVRGAAGAESYKERER